MKIHFICKKCRAKDSITVVKSSVPGVAALMEVFYKKLKTRGMVCKKCTITKLSDVSQS